MILSVENLHSGYGRIPVLTGVSFVVKDGESLGILGHNGMGKTTLLRTLIGHLPVTKGRIVFQSEVVSSDPPHERARCGLGYVPQGRGIFPRLSVKDNLRIGCAGRGRDEARAIEGALLHFPRLARLLDRQGGALSGGEQQLLALARCLCGNPQLILLDEPTEGIQPSIVEEIGGTLKQLNRDSKLSLIVVEQNIEFLTNLSHRIIRLQKGRISGEVDPTALTRSASRGQVNHDAGMA